MKKITLLLFVLFVLPIKINAQESVFIFGYEYVEIPYNADVNPYFELVYNSIKLKPGYSDPQFSVDDENDGFFKSVIFSHHLKSYYLIYRAEAPRYNQVESRKVEFKIVDHEPPKVTHHQPITYLLEHEKPNYLNYIKASDNETKPEDINITVNDFFVDYTRVGTYEVIYTITDNSHNQTIHVSFVYVEDKIKPTIIPTELTTLQLGRNLYIEDFFTVKDNHDSNPEITYTIEGNLDEVGEILLHITVKDQSNNQASLTRKVRIIDQIPPDLKLSKQIETLHVFDEPIDLYSYVDSMGKNLNFADLKIEGVIDYDKTGVYEVLYTLTDKHGNQTIKVLTIKIVDKTKPVIDSKDIIIDVGDALDLLDGVHVKDNYTNQPNIRIYETNYKPKPGTYYVIYEAVDEAGNHSYFTRTITVKGQTTEQKIYLYIVFAVVVSLCGLGGFILYKKRKTL